jgi:hypothetical protein
MDLKALLEANKSKIKNTRPSPVRKPADIADCDRPYSALPISPAEQLSGPENLEKKWQQTDNKPTTNRQQKWQQTDNKPTTNRQQTVDKYGDKNKNWQQSGNKTGNTIGNKVATKWQQTDNKVATKTRFSELVGLQKDIIIFVCHECKNNRSRITEALTLEYIATGLKRRPGVVKTTIQRLEKKNCLLRVEFKNGRGGWSRYEVPDHIYHDALRNETGNKVVTNWQQTGNKLATQPTTELATSPSSSSSLNINTTTTELSDEWKFDITSYARFGFTQTQLKQIVSLGVVSADEVEQSLIEFSYDLDNNLLPSIKTTKINFLMGLLRSGHTYISERFKNEQEAMIAEMARRAEGKRKKLLEEKFLAWEASLNDDDRKFILSKLPTSLMVLEKTYGISNDQVKNWYLDYFIQNAKG